MKIGKIILIVLILALVGIQFVRPAKNTSNVKTYDVATKYPVPTEVANILDVACNDCHTNLTKYPWYASVQPVAWFLNDHVVDGKRHLNFSEFTNRPIAVQNHKFEEVIEMVKEKEMPLPSYTWLGLHSDAKLSDAQRETLINWAQTQMDSLKAQYPADSLVLRRRNAPAPSK
ncbi:MAG: heme-binding domain-containing protein [Saprospiraceae bacterium]|nr:heme-binding domain-containing protein [Saprospiraceae bacterium]